MPARSSSLRLNRLTLPLLAVVAVLWNCSFATADESAADFRQLLSGDQPQQDSTADLVSPASEELVLPETGEFVLADEVPIEPSIDVSFQLADLQSQIATQSQEIALLRTQLQHQPTRELSTGRSKLFATYESVLVQPVQSNPTGVIIETESGGYSHVMFPWEIEHSPRVEFGYEAAGDAFGWRVRYWQFDHTESFVINEENGLLPGGYEATAAYLSDDGDYVTGLAMMFDGEFSSSIRTDVIDWELQRQLGESIDVYGGIRYAKVAQQYAALSGADQLHARSEFRGLGPTVAVRLAHPLPLNRLALFANIRGSLLFGQKEFGAVDNVNQVSQQINAVDLRSGDDNVDSFAGNAEMQLGIQYIAADWLALRCALEAQHYNNVGGANPTAEFVSRDRGLNGDSPMDDDLSFIGLAAGAEFGW